MSDNSVPDSDDQPPSPQTDSDDTDAAPPTQDTDPDATRDPASDTATDPASDTATDPATDTTADPATDTTADPATGMTSDPTVDSDVYPTFEDEAAPSSDSEAAAGSPTDGVDVPGPDLDGEDDVPPDVRKYDRFKKIEGGTYDRANEFLRERTYITAREWAIARLCADFRTETGVEMTKIGENLPELVPFMTDTYTPQAVNQARHSFEEKVRKAGATFLYGAMCDFFTAEELDDVMYEATEVAKFLLEVEGVELSVEEELEAEDRISEVMREVREHSAALRHDECPHCGNELEGRADDGGTTAEADD